MPGLDGGGTIGGFVGDADYYYFLVNYFSTGGDTKVIAVDRMTRNVVASRGFTPTVATSILYTDGLWKDADNFYICILDRNTPTPTTSFSYGIRGFSASKTFVTARSVSSGGTFSLTLDIETNSDSTPTILWSSPQGTFDSTSAQRVSHTAPTVSSETTYDITATVTVDGVVRTATLPVTVTP